MTNERQINGGNELMNFFCKDEDKKEYCKFIVDDENKCIYTGIYTSYEDEDELYNDLMNPNIKWNVITFEFDYSPESNCEVLCFENDENYIEFIGVDYNDVKDFFKVKK